MVLTISKQLFQETAKWLNLRIPQGRLFRSAALLSGTTLLVQIVGIALSPVYARLYSPQDYGIFGQFYSVLNILMVIGGFCYEMSIPTVEETEEALTLVVLSVLCLLLITCGSLLWVLLSIWGKDSMPKNRLYLLLLPLGVLLAGMYRIAQYWAIRAKSFQAIAGSALRQMIGGQAVNLSFGLLHPNPLGLILGQIFSSSAGVGHLSKATELPKLLKANRGSVFRTQHLLSVAKKHRQYTLTQCPSVILNSLGLYLPGALALPFYGANFAGQYNLAQRIGRIPVTLVGSSVSQVFFSEAAVIARSDPGALRRLFDSFSQKLAACSVIVVIGCMFAPLAIPTVFGARWQTAGSLIMWLSFGLGFQLCVSPLSNIPNVVGKLKGQFVIDSLRAAAVFAALYVPHRLAMSGITAMISYSTVLVANYVACYWLYRHHVTVHARKVPKGTQIEGNCRTECASVTES